MTTKMLKCLFSLLFILSLSFNFAFATETDGHQDGHKTEKFKPGDFIVDHIADSHEWHIATFGHTHVTVPLPIIVQSTQTGKWHAFMSSNFHHGHDLYKGFGLGTEGEHKGKIYEVDASGQFVGYPLDFSLTKTAVAIIISVILMLVIFLNIAKAYTRRPGQAPKGLQSAIEPLILFIRDDVAKPMIGEKKHERYLPFLLTVFFFIFINNLLGLVPWFPGGANVTGNISVTLVLAALVFIITTFSGKKDYWMHIVWTPGVPWWLKVPIPLMPLVEFSGIIIKPFVLMVRLFANILAGHIIALGFYSLIFIFGGMAVAAGFGVSIVSIAFTIFMTVLELLVAFIQAFVFMLLAAIYFGQAVEEHHHEEHAH